MVIYPIFDTKNKKETNTRRKIRDRNFLIEKRVIGKVIRSQRICHLITNIIITWPRKIGYKKTWLE